MWKESVHILRICRANLECMKSQILFKFKAKIKNIMGLSGTQMGSFGQTTLYQKISCKCTFKEQLLRHHWRENILKVIIYQGNILRKVYMLPTPLHNCSGGGGEKGIGPIYTPPPGHMGKGEWRGGGSK